MAYRNRNYDSAMHRELELSIQNDYPTYQKQMALVQNYQRKAKRGVYNRAAAERGMNNLIVTPFARKYQRDFRGVKVGKAERAGIARALTRYAEREFIYPRKKNYYFPW